MLASHVCLALGFTSHLDVASTAARASSRCRRLGLEHLEEANVLQRVPD
jgi:hypothetical protein